MKKLGLIAFLFLVPAFIRAQQYLVPFEDYRTCLTGFRTQKGDTIWPALFDKATGSHGWDGAFWLVAQDEKVGLLDQKGQLLYPCAYENLRYYREIGTLVIDSAHLSCIRSPKSELLLPFRYNDIQPVIYDKKTYYEVELDGKKGLLDAAFNEIIPIIYSKIAIGRESGSLFAKKNFISVESASKWGAFRWDGTEIFPAAYATFRSLEVCSAYPDNQTVDQLFSFKQLNGIDWIQGVTDAQGKELFKSQDTYNSEAFSISTTQPEVQKTVVLVYKNLTNYVIAFSKDNPTRFTPEMESIAPIHNGLLGMKGDSVYFFNLQMECCGQFKGSAETLLNQISSYYTTNNLGYYGDQVSKLLLKKDFSIHFSTGPQQHEACYLYSSTHHKSSKKHYRKIERYALLDKEFYWCYQVNSHHKWRLDILNDSLEVVAHFKQAPFPVSDHIIIQATKEILLNVDNQHRKSGLIAVDGTIIIPLRYERIQEDEQGIYQAIQPGSELSDYYLPSGQLLAKDVLNFQAINTKVYAIQHKNNYYSLYSKSFELLMDSCAEVIRADYYLPVEHYSIASDWIVLKNGHFFGLHGEDVHAINPNDFGFGSVKNAFGKFLLGSDNEILYRGKIIDYNQFYLVEEADSVHWVKRDGKVLRSLKKSSIQITDKYVFLRDGENTAVLNTQTAAWVVQPQPLSVIVDMNNEAGIWGKLPSSNSWVLLDSTGKQLVEQPFEFPVPINSKTAAIFLHDQRFGLLNQDLKLLLPAQYKAIFDLNGAYCFKKDVKWGLLSSTGKQMNPLFDAITPIERSDNIVVFQEQRVGILDKKLNWILPLMSFDSVIEHTDLARLLDMNVVSPKDFSDSVLLREITNRELLIQLSGSYIREGVPLLRFDRKNFHFPSDYILPKEKEYDYNYATAYNHVNLCDRQLLNENYYSVSIKKEDYSTYDMLIKGHFLPIEANSGRLDYQTFYNFTIVQDSLIPMVLADLFKEGTHEQLNTIIEQEIVRQQIFGINCVNLPEKISQIKSKFYLSHNGLVLFGASDKQLFISYDKLKEMLRYPELFP